MEKASFFYYYFNFPLFAFLISVLLTSLFIIMYSLHLDKKTLSYNGFLKNVVSNENYLGNTFIVAAPVSGVISLLGGAVMYAHVRDDHPSLYSSTIVHISYIFYLIPPILILILLFQPKISEKKDIIRRQSNQYEQVSSLVDSYITIIGKYSMGYAEKTNIEISQINSAFEILKIQLNFEKSHIIENHKIKSIYESIDKLKALEIKSNQLYNDFIKFQSKEIKVFEYINNLEFDIKFKDINNKSLIQEKYNYIKNLIDTDFSKAYQFVIRQQ
jgi:hypothetical protein